VPESSVSLTGRISSVSLAETISECTRGAAPPFFPGSAAPHAAPSESRLGRMGVGLYDNNTVLNSRRRLRFAALADSSTGALVLAAERALKRFASSGRRGHQLDRSFWNLILVFIRPYGFGALTAVAMTHCVRQAEEVTSENSR
jgi:hypothetical protein